MLPIVAICRKAGDFVDEMLEASWSSLLLWYGEGMCFMRGEEATKCLLDLA